MTKIVQLPVARDLQVQADAGISIPRLQDAWRREMEREQIDRWTVRDVPSGDAHRPEDESLSVSESAVSKGAHGPAQRAMTGGMAAQPVIGDGGQSIDSPHASLPLLLAAVAYGIETTARVTEAPGMASVGPDTVLSSLKSSASSPDSVFGGSEVADDSEQIAATDDLIDWGVNRAADVPQKQRMHLVTEGQDVDVWIRDGTLDTATARKVIYRLAGTFAESGMRLRGATINGREAFRASERRGNRDNLNETRAAVSATVVSSRQAGNQQYEIQAMSGGDKTWQSVQ